ncbi:MAG: WG repeat-containing protein [Chitinophagaceae bacterium]|nr:WG repeat-containing protein [Chitinophagaceae bacterium]
MPKILFLVATLMLVITANSQKIVPCSCKEQTTGKTQYGYCDSLRTKYVIPCQFDSAYSLSNGLARVIKEGKVGYLDVSGKLVIPAVYEEGENFSDGFAYVKKDGHYFYINKSGLNQYKKNFPLPSLPKMEGLSEGAKKILAQQMATMRQESSFQEGLAKFYDTASKKIGFINTKGIIVLPEKYVFATKFSGGIGIVKELVAGPATAIDKTGKQLFSMEADILPAGEYKSGFIKIMKRLTGSYKFNYLDAKGKPLFASFYDEISGVENGYFILTSTGSSGGKKMGAGNTTGKVLIDPAYDYLGTSVIKGIFYYANKNSKGAIEAYGVMDSAGKRITGTSYFEFEKANDTVLVARKKEGSYDLKYCHYTLLSIISGKELCKPDYLYKEWNTVKGQPILYLLQNRYNTGSIRRQNWCFFNPKKGVLAEYDDDLVNTHYKLGLFIAPKEGRIFDLMGTTLLDSAKCITLNEYRKDIQNKESDIVLVKGEKTKKWYAYNLVTKKIILSDLEVFGENYGYGVHKSFTEGMLPVQKNGLWGYADANGKMVIPCKYTEANSFYYGWAVVVQEGSKHFLINKEGKKMPGVETSWAEDFYEGIAKVSTSFDSPKGEQVYYINTTGRIIFTAEVPEIFENGDMSDGLAAVCNKNKKYGYIDKTGKLVIPYQFDLVQDKYPKSIAFENGKATVKKDGKTITIDKTGKEIR